MKNPYKEDLLAQFYRNTSIDIDAFFVSLSFGGVVMPRSSFIQERNLIKTSCETLCCGASIFVHLPFRYLPDGLCYEFRGLPTQSIGGQGLSILMDLHSEVSDHDLIS